MIKILDKLTPKSYAGIVLVTAAYITLVFNSLFLYKTYVAAVSTGHWDGLFLLSVPLLLFMLSCIFLTWFSLISFIKPLAILSVLISAVVFYAVVNYGVIFDKDMLRNMVETDTGEAFSYLNLSLLLYVVLLGLLPALILLRTKFTQSFGARLKSFLVINLVCITASAAIMGAFYEDYVSIGRNNRQLTSYITPFAFYTASYKFVRDKYFLPPLPFQLLDNAPSLLTPEQGSLTVLIVGETARAKNFSLGSYTKPTNLYTPELGVKFFSDVSACGTATAISVPCMFSRLNRQQFKQRLAQSQENALDIIHRAGVDVLWLDNNSSCKGVCARVENVNIATSSSQPLCDGQFCYDEILVQQLVERLAQQPDQQQTQHENKQKNKPASNRLIVLHMIGSHGPTYYRRYPPSQRRFTPDCARSDIQNCTEAELANSYDNTISYTDYILSRVIKVLQQQTAENLTLLYVSDHGESLGENGLYLHGFPYSLAPKEQTQVPLIYWSNQLANQNYNDCVNQQLAKPLSHDNIFDTLLGITHVATKLYQPELDIFTPCKQLQKVGQVIAQSN
ncbi:phosphoethanolamine transferase [Rheinheimera salexigens]|uniref:Phosphoethanolamine transferase n=2 Tax=Rheinheimera salexigens TaxID=1628148 RepID=A0A1E7Q737_9GAMM|nr:phosphoethanolamine transferase [Rheinheimera salexigens]